MSAEVIRMDNPVDNVVAEPAFIELEPTEVHQRVSRGQSIIVDVREASEYENVRIPSAFLMPLSFFEADHFPIISGTEVILMCAVGKRSAAAAKQLMNSGFDEVIHMKGGINKWIDDGLPVDED
ncbi:MAG: rhodanese-like domain-containing protein [Rhodospirillaceae bacterium]|nr:rhodanese-like domain-containing protein [Rhodospirillaceae bacterium]